MTKVLFLIHDLAQGGAEKVLVALANNIDKSKFDVTVETLFDFGENRQFLNNDVTYKTWCKKKIRGNAYLFKYASPKLLSKIVKINDYDIVIAFLEGPSTKTLSKYYGKKVAWVHTDFQALPDLLAHYKSFNEMKNCYDNYDKIICVANTVKNSFCELSATDTPCEVLYNVNQTDLIEEKSNEKQDTIISNDEVFNIVSSGRLIPLKQFDQLINIHKRLIDNNIINNLYILGEGDEHKNLQDQINNLGLNNTCKLLGFNDNPYKYIKNSNLFVCSSRQEGFSTAVTEALILGVPVVSTDVSGARELLGNNNEYGIVTEISEDTLYEGVYKMLTEEGLLAHYKKQAEIRGKEFSTEKTTKAVEEMLDGLLCQN